MAEARRRRSISQAYLLDLLNRQLSEHSLGEPGPLEVIDLGGGTGGVATSLAAEGHRVTVIDPSPDALASLDRRAVEAGQSDRIQGRQGDAGDLAELVGPHSADVVVCHRVLEVVDSPAEALAAMAAVLRPGGRLSLLVSQRHSVVLTQALAGHIALARRTYADPSRFDYQRVIRLVEGAQFTVLASHGIGAVADHVPEALVEGEPGNYDDLLALEAEISQDPAFRAMAPNVHVFAQLR
jgi:S-adenosylmethionine-dependent methyltransferase